jgi:LysM repeat protein
MRLRYTLALVGSMFLLAACGAGPKSSTSLVARQPTDPKAVPTATLPAVLPSPIPAGTVTEGGITGQASTGPTTYIIRSGDTMGMIAARLGVPLAGLLSYNPGVDPANLKIGQELRVPPPPTPTLAPTTAPLRPATSSPSSSSPGARTPTPSATSTRASPTSSSSGAGGQTYTIQTGDTACKIAGNFNIGLQELAAANGTTAAALATLRVGQELKIPRPTGAQQGC